MKPLQLSGCLLLVTLSTCYNVSDLTSDYSSDLTSDLTSDYSLIMGPEDNMTELTVDTSNHMETEIEEEKEDQAPIDTGRRKGGEYLTLPYVLGKGSFKKK